MEDVVQPEDARANRRRLRDPDDSETPPAQRQRTASIANKEEKLGKEISELIEFCNKHGDQRSFKELFAACNDARQWNQRQLNITTTADAMDLKTIREQWFLMANLSGISKEQRILCNLRLGVSLSLLELAQACSNSLKLAQACSSSRLFVLVCVCSGIL